MILSLVRLQGSSTIGSLTLLLSYFIITMDTLAEMISFTLTHFTILMSSLYLDFLVCLLEIFLKHTWIYILVANPLFDYHKSSTKLNLPSLGSTENFPLFFARKLFLSPFGPFELEPKTVQILSSLYNLKHQKSWFFLGFFCFLKGIILDVFDGFFISHFACWEKWGKVREREKYLLHTMSCTCTSIFEYI